LLRDSGEKEISFSKVIPWSLVQDNLIGEFSVNFLFPFIDQIVSDVGISIFLSEVTNPLSIK
jgi:hypothetical protein